MSQESSAVDTPLVSIIVAVKNGVHTLQRCIDSVEEQTYGNRELIIMDAASTDGTAELLRMNEARIRHWESEADRGIPHAWNKGLTLSAGEWVCFLGADDFFWDSRSLQLLVEVGEVQNADLVTGRVALVDRGGTTLRIIGAPWDWTAMKRFQVVAHHGMLHRKHLFERYGQFKEEYRIACDYDFLLRLGAEVEGAFVNTVVAGAEAFGDSRSFLRAALRESYSIQAMHPDIDNKIARANYFVALSKAAVRRLFRVY